MRGRFTPGATDEEWCERRLLSRIHHYTLKRLRAEIDPVAARDFLDNLKGRKRPIADVEEGHRSTTFSHLANIALATRCRLEWDAQAERVTNCDAANALLHYEYRQPW